MKSFWMFGVVWLAGPGEVNQECVMIPTKHECTEAVMAVERFLDKTYPQSQIMQCVGVPASRSMQTFSTASKYCITYPQLKNRLDMYERLREFSPNLKGGSNDTDGI
jgi:hypothetical protein